MIWQVSSTIFDYLLLKIYGNLPTWAFFIQDEASLELQNASKLFLDLAANSQKIAFTGKVTNK